MSAADWERRYRLSGRWRDLVRWLEALHAAGECARVVEIVEREQKKFPRQSLRWQYLRARCLIDLGHMDTAREVLDSLLATQPDHGKALELRYHVARHEGDADTATRVRERLEVLGWDTNRLHAAQDRAAPAQPQAPAVAPETPAVSAWERWVQQAQSIDSWLVSMQNVVGKTPDVENFLRIAEQEG